MGYGAGFAAGAAAGAAVSGAAHRGKRAILIPALIALFACGELLLQGEDIYKKVDLEVAAIKGEHLKFK